jgi:hypothetical protein
MKNHNQDGTTDVLLLPLIIAVVLLVASLGFGFWAFGQYQDYKNNADQKVAAAVVRAKQTEDTVKDKQYAEAAKLPFKTYTGPEETGTLSLQYPKTWSGYVVSSTTSGNAALEGYFNPNIVPSVQDQSSIFALRISVVDSAYSDVLQSLQDQQGATITPYALPKVPKAVGVRVEGQIENQKSGTMVILPLRDKTLEVYTESNNYEADFNNNILPNLSFIP